jgi:group I intron endonuclease
MKIKGLVYKLRNKINGKVYVGQTITIVEKRVAGHLRCKDPVPIARALKKYGLQSFVVSTIDTAISKVILDEKEIYWIARCKSHVSQGGYNIAFGGGGTVGVKKKDYEKAAVSASSRKRVGFLSPRFGVKHTVEARRKMSIARKGRKLSAEWRRKIGLSVLGYRHTDEAKRKISLSKLGKSRPDLAERNRQRAKIHLVA